MAFQDSELDKLGRLRDEAFREVDRLRALKDQASDTSHRLHNSYDYKLDYYKTRIPALKIEIGYAIAQSKDCYAVHDHIGASSWSDTGRRLKQELSEAYDDKNQKVEELRQAGTEFREAQENFRRAKADYVTAREAFTKRLEYLKAEAERKRAERDAEFKKRKEAQEQERQERERRKKKREGNRQKFIDWAIAAFLLKTLEAYQDDRRSQAREYTDETGKTKRHQAQAQSRNKDCTVKVNYGYSRDDDVYQTDIYVFQHGINEHLHIVFDEDGNELFQEWRPNH